MGDNVVTHSPLVGPDSPRALGPPDPDVSGGCWPCGERYNLVGGNSRFKRKTIIGFLCLFLVIVVVLAIIIFAVTRDSVGTLESTEEQLVIKDIDNLERLLKTTPHPGDTYKTTEKLKTRPSSTTTTGIRTPKPPPKPDIEFEEFGDDVEDPWDDLKVITPRLMPTTTSTTTRSSTSTSRRSTPTMSKKSGGAFEAMWDDYDEDEFDDETSTSSRTTTTTITTRRSTTSTTRRSSRKSTTTLEPELKRLRYLELLQNATSNLSGGKGNSPFDEEQTKELKEAIQYLFETEPLARMIGDESQGQGDDTKRTARFLTDLLSQERPDLTREAKSENETSPTSAALQTTLFSPSINAMFGTPLDGTKSKEEEPEDLTEEEEKTIIANKVQTLLQLLDEKPNATTAASSAAKYDLNLEWLKKLNNDLDVTKNETNTSLPFNIDSGIYQKVITAWDKYLENERNFGFGQIYDDIMDAKGIDLARTSADPEPDLVVIHQRKIDFINRTLSEIQQIDPRIASETSGSSVSFNARCEDNQLMCADGKSCYFKNERCDRWINCADNSDEVGCTCVEYLPREKICDGYPDCLKGEDEVGCGCPKGSFRCEMDEQVPKCISMELRCDNIKDCPDGKDEKNCFALSETILDPTAFGSSQSKGLLHVRTSSGWDVLGLETVGDVKSLLQRFIQGIGDEICSEVLTQPKVDAQVQILNPDNFTDLAHLTIKLGSQADDVLSTVRDGGRYLYNVGPPHAGCMVISVDCGQPVCGVRSLLPDGPSFAMAAVKTGLKFDSVTTGFAKGKYLQEDESQETSEDFYDPLAANDSQLPIATDDTDYESQFPNVTVNDDDVVEEDKINEAELYQLRIVGGNESRPQTWPFVVALLRDGKFICGSTIIAEQWIITAGHCLFEYDTKKYLFQILVGTLRRNSNAPSQYVRTIEEVYMHDQYNKTWLFNDLALGKVDKPFIFSQSVSTVCLPDELLFKKIDFGTRVIPQPGDRCYAVGWGNTNEVGTTSDNLMEVPIPILPTCKNSYNNVTYQVCGGYKEGGKDSCQGDSGGPLFCEHPTSPGTWYLGGVISHGVGCARPDNPGVYTRVNYYLNWIKNIIGGTQTRSSTLPERRANTNCTTMTCDGGRCLAGSLVCNFFVDCFDGTDELGCVFDAEGVRIVSPTSSTTTTTITTSLAAAERSSTAVFSLNKIVECSRDMFSCRNTRQCIPKSKVCNLKKDCIDGTDERGCMCRDYLEKLVPSRLCDGYPDCHDWSDEIGCKYCDSPNLFFCDLSKKCISRSKVCDKTNDCFYREDERYCLTLINGDSITLKRDGRPLAPNVGLVALNTDGIWKFVCTEKWDDVINDRSCKYTGKRAAFSYRLIPNDNTSLIIQDTPIKITNFDEPSIYPRSIMDNDNDESFEKRSLLKRSSDCSFVETNCTKSPTCGVMPLYNFMAVETPEFGQGVFPWQVNIYSNGTYLCGASLIHNSWILTHASCAAKCNPSTEYCVARMGSFRDQYFQSVHEQFRRIVMFVQLPVDGKDVFLGTFDFPVNMTEYINTLCIPSVTWIPKGTECFMTGKGEGALNHAIKTTLVNACDVVNENNFKVCTKQEKPSFECLKNWSGSLVCPDGTGKYYAVGIYFSEKGGCDLNNPIPNKFPPLMTSAIRDNIAKVVKTADDGPNPYFGLEDKLCNKTQGFMRCPLGQCLSPSQICDGVPDCIDLSDEEPKLCDRDMRQCQHLNTTHCVCLANDLMCANNNCVDKSRFCNGVDDCGDGTDEPLNCDTQCTVALATLDPAKLCDGKIDCLGEHDLGADESAELCCKTFDADSKAGDFRCVSGVQNVYNQSLISLSNQCIPSRFVCDYNAGVNVPSCKNGAEEENCFRLWNLNSDIPLDPYGRMTTEAQGYLYFISNGKKFLYCASRDIFVDPLLPAIGKALCEKAQFTSLVSIKMTEAASRQRLGSGNTPLSLSEDQSFQKCMIVHLVCGKSGKDST